MCFIRICTNYHPSSGYFERDSSHGIISLEKEMATHSSILAWKIAWTEESVGLSMGLQSQTWQMLSIHAHYLSGCQTGVSSEIPWGACLNRSLSPTPRVSDSAGLGWDWKFVFLEVSRWYRCCKPRGYTLRTIVLFYIYISLLKRTSFLKIIFTFW